VETSKAVGALGALAHDTRLEIFRLLVQGGPDGMPAGQIAAKLGLPPPTLSFHLSHLKQAGLIGFRRNSRLIIYTADYAAMTDLLGYLTENCCQGQTGACAIPACAPQRTPKRIQTRPARREKGRSGR
jgi:DNA-binding transcriptional ArsR family regulator